MGEVSLKDLIEGYFAVDYTEKHLILAKITNYIGLDKNTFNILLDKPGYCDIVVRTIYKVECEFDKLLNRPLTNLISILNNKELESDVKNDCIDSYCGLMNTLLRRDNFDISLIRM